MYLLVAEGDSFLDFFDTCRNIVKLTAQFVARNGRQFLTNLMNREQVSVNCTTSLSVETRL